MQIRKLGHEFEKKTKYRLISDVIQQILVKEILSPESHTKIPIVVIRNYDQVTQLPDLEQVSVMMQNVPLRIKFLSLSRAFAHHATEIFKKIKS